MHKHEQPCLHKKLEWCEKCDVVECVDCEKEWKICDQPHFIYTNETVHNPIVKNMLL